MNAVEGLKIFKLGEDDWFFAETKEMAIKELEDMYGEEDAQQIIKAIPPKELSDEDIDRLRLFEIDESNDCIDESKSITFREGLLEYAKKGEKSGFFSSSEY